MTCEFCGKSQMDVQEREIRNVMKFASCISCCRTIDTLATQAYTEASKAFEIVLKGMMKFPGGMPKN